MTETEQAREAAIMALRLAIISLETGELVDADNHVAHARCWMREIPNVESSKPSA